MKRRRGEIKRSNSRWGDTITEGKKGHLNFLATQAQHKAITKHARKTNHIERFNNTLRQRVSRLVRDTLAFSKAMSQGSCNLGQSTRLSLLNL